MKLGNNNFALNIEYSFKNEFVPNGTTVTAEASGNVIVSAYSINTSTDFTLYLISNNDNLAFNATDWFGNNKIWEPSAKSTDLDTYLLGGSVNRDKYNSTKNELVRKYGTLYYYAYQFRVGGGGYSDETISISITNSFYFDATGYGGGTSGKFKDTIAFDIGEAQDLAGSNKAGFSIGKLFEYADGDLNKDIGNPENPLDPSPESDGEVVFKLGSAGTGNGFNTYKLKWDVVHDSESVNYSEMDFSVGFYQDSLETKGGIFKKQKVANGGTLDFSYANAVSVAGWSWLDKLKDKLPILDPSPTLLSINFYIDAVKVFELGLPCLLYYDGSVKIISLEQVRPSITWSDSLGNKYTLIAGNNEDENNKDDMEDDDKDKDDDEKGDGDDKNYTGGTDSVNGSALLTTSYSLSISDAHSFGSWLWGSTLIDDIRLVNNNPIENIVSCKLFPFSVGGTETQIQIGNVTSNVTGQKLAENVARTFVLNGGNPITVPRYYSRSDVYGGKYAYLDNAPFTSCRIYLPYLGIKELDASEVLGKNLYIKYYVDLVTGMCRAVIQTDKRSLYIFDGQIGQDVPITASNRAQVEVGYITGGLQSATQIAMGAMTGNVFGVISGINGAINTATNQYHSETKGTPTPCNSRFDSQTAYIIVDRPDLPNIPSKFAHQNGRICNKTLTISNLTGYTELDNTVDLSGIQCTSTERSELLSILSSGFYA